MTVNRPFLSDQFMDVTLPRLNARGLETDLRIDGRSVTFERRGEVAVTTDVVVQWAGRVPSVLTGGTTRVIGEEGDLHGRPGELVVLRGDLFMLEGKPAEVTIDAKVIDGVAVAGFRMTGGGS